jgi:hypothetical protein
MRGNAATLKGFILLITMDCYREVLFALLKNFMNKSESRQPQVPFHVTHCSADAREATLPAMDVANRPLCTQKVEEWICEHRTGVSRETKTTFSVLSTSIGCLVSPWHPDLLKETERIDYAIVNFSRHPHH